MVRKTAELGLDAVDLLAQRLLWLLVLLLRLRRSRVSPLCLADALIVARDGFEREVGRLLQDGERNCP